MKLDRFVSERTEAWTQLDAMVKHARGRPERLGTDGLLALGALYRSAAADLALARRRWPGDPVVARLEDVVGRARHLVYDSQGRRGSLVSFFSHTYWRRIGERPVPLALAAALLVAPLLLAALWAAADPAAAGGLIPGRFQGSAPAGGDLGIPAAGQAALASQIFTNNIQVTFLAFAGGIAAGLGTAVVLLYNGVVIGAVAGLAVDAGAAGPFAELVSAHGVLELSCIVVTAAAGLRMGWALIEPGRIARGQALVAEARRAVEIVLGTIPWLVLAGLVEGFVTPAGLGLSAALAIGFSLGGLFWTLVYFRGRSAATAAPVPSL